MNSSLNHIINGFMIHFRTVSMYRKHKFLWKYSFLPLLINVVLMVALFITVIYFGLPAIQNWVSGHGEHWVWNILSGLAGFFAFIVFLILTFLLFLLAANIISAPFNDMLSEKLERSVWPEASRTWPTLSISKILWISIAEEAKKMLFLFGTWIMLLPLNLIPIIGSLLYFAVNMYFTFLTLSLEYTGYCLDRRGYTFREKRAFTRRYKHSMLGFGAGVACILAVPLVNFFLIPAAVVGGSLLSIELLREEFHQEKGEHTTRDAR